MVLISVREHEKLFIGKSDPKLPSVTSKQAEKLTSLKPIYGFELFKYLNQHTLVAQQYVGSIQLGVHTLEVLPKIDSYDQQVRRNLIRMLSVAHDLDISEGEAVNVAVQSYGILEIMIRLFCDKLSIQLRKGLVRKYELREENLAVLRGRIGVTEQLRLNAANPERLFCRHDDFQEDIPLNQIFKAGVRFLLDVSCEADNQRRLSEFMLIFEGVSDIPRQSLPWNRVSFDRLTEHYRACYNLVELILKRNPPDLMGGNSKAFSLFFDMNVLFEEYIGRVTRKIFTPMGYRVNLQGPQRHLAIDIDKQHPVFTLKPDITGRVDEQIAWIIDTKWKSLSLQKVKEGVLQEDLYQMYAYAQCYNCSDTVLLYPHNHDLGDKAGVRASFSLNHSYKSCITPLKKVRVATIELSDLNEVPEQLIHIIQAGENDPK